jgi:hypothetical protein
VDALPADYFGPFSKETATDYMVDDLGAGCIGWELPSTPTPVIPEGVTSVDVPALILSGDFDNTVSEGVARSAAAVFKDAIFLDVPQAFHGVLNWQYPCVSAAIARFIDDQTAESEICHPPDYHGQAAAFFAPKTADASLDAVNISRKNRSRDREVKAAVSGVRAVYDAVERGVFIFGEGRCLRGGTYKTSGEGNPYKVMLNNCRFTEDLKVNGVFKWAAEFAGGDSILHAQLKLSGPATSGGHATVSGPLFKAGATRWLKVRGRLGGKKVAFSTPSY